MRVYAHKSKSEVFEKFNLWKVMVEKSRAMKDEVCRPVNGSKYTFKEFKEYLKKQGTECWMTVQKTSQKTELQKELTEHL